MVWLAVTVLAAIKLPQPRRAHIRRLWPLLTFPALVVMAGLATETGLVERVMFETHRPGLERLVTKVTTAPNQHLADQRVGLYALSSVVVERGGCTKLTVRDAGFFEARGFAYCPGKPPIDDVRGGEGTAYEPIAGAWYTFSFRF